MDKVAYGGIGTRFHKYVTNTKYSISQIRYQICYRYKVANGVFLRSL